MVTTIPPARCWLHPSLTKKEGKKRIAMERNSSETPKNVAGLKQDRMQGKD